MIALQYSPASPEGQEVTSAPVRPLHEESPLKPQTEPIGRSPEVLSPSDPSKALGLAKSSRLHRLRQALLDAPYQVCIQKAALMTESFKHRADDLPALRAAAARWHYQLYARGLTDQVNGVSAATWKTTVNTELVRWYLTGQDETPGSVQLDYANAFQYILEHMDLKVYDDELIVGNASSHRMGAPLHPDYGGILLLPELKTLDRRDNNPMQLSEADRIQLEEEIFPFWFYRSILALTPLYSDHPELTNTLTEGVSFVLTQFSGISHLAPDYPKVLKVGFQGILAEILEKAQLTRETLRATTDPQTRQALEEKLVFYDASRIVTEAAIAYGARVARHLERAAAEAHSEERRQELLDLAQICRRVPAQPAATFHEALQSICLTHVMVHQESFQHGVSFGRIDQYLHPYYARDIAAGRLDPGRALELIGCFLGKAAELLPLFIDRATEYFSGLSSASGLTLGGQDADGKDATNPLSFLFLHAYDQLRLRQPNIHVRVHQGSDPTFMALCHEVLKKGGGIPAFFNDDEIIPALTSSGVAHADAQEYAIVGCCEWGVPHSTFQAAGAGFINLPFALELALHNGRHAGAQQGPETGEIHALQSPEAVFNAFATQLEHQIALAVAGNNAIEEAHARHRPTPCLSVLVDGCLDRGMEVNAGGARYNPTGFQGVGLADVADSLAAIEQLVFQERTLELAELVGELDRDFQDEGIRQRLQNRVAKYGENEGRPERFMARVGRSFAKALGRFTNPRGGRYNAGFWSMTTHQGFGHRTGALPSGRKAGQPLANGISPCDGRDRLGPTAAMLSAAHLETALVQNGCVLNQKLAPSLVKGARGTLMMDSLLRGYFKKGGMQVQFNILDPEVLLRARENPDAYRDLVVRISGYSAYFNDLTEEMKDELIARTLHQSMGSA